MANTSISGNSLLVENLVYHFYQSLYCKYVKIDIILDQEYFMPINIASDCYYVGVLTSPIYVSLASSESFASVLCSMPHLVEGVLYYCFFTYFILLYIFTLHFPDVLSHTAFSPSFYEYVYIFTS
jgi:hypothetical protein